MKKIILLIVITFTSNLITSQTNIDILKKKVEGTILLKDGTKLTGDFRIPQIGKKSISYFDKNNSKQDILSDSIDKLLIKNNNGKYSILLYTYVGVYKKSKGKFYAKKKKKKGWLLEVVSGKKAKLYITGNRYKQMKDGSIDVISDGNAHNPPSFNYYAKMEGRDEFPIFIDIYMGGISIGSNAVFKRYASHFFESKNKTLSDKIKNKEEGYKNKNRVQIFLDYNSL